MFRVRTVAAVIAVVALSACANDDQPVAAGQTATTAASDMEQRGNVASPEIGAWCIEVVDQHTIIDDRDIRDGTDATNHLIPWAHVARDVAEHARDHESFTDELEGALQRLGAAADDLEDIAHDIGELDRLDQVRPALADRYEHARFEFHAAVTALHGYTPDYGGCFQNLPALFGERADTPTAPQELVAACEQFDDRVNSLERGTESVADWLRFVEVVPDYLADVLAVARFAVPEGAVDAEWRTLVDDVDRASERIFALYRHALEGADPGDDGDTVLSQHMESEEWAGPVLEFEGLLGRFDAAAGIACLA